MKSWHEVGQTCTGEAGLSTFPREQFLVVCPWPQWFVSAGNVIFRLDDLTGVAHDDDPVFGRRAFEESCADLPQADVMVWCDGTRWCGSGVVIHWPHRCVPGQCQSGGIPDLFGVSAPHVATTWRARHDDNNRYVIKHPGSSLPSLWGRWIKYQSLSQSQHFV